MSSIADSRADREDDRVWPQHQAVATLLQGWLSNPSVHSLRWLDLACGRGQILTSVRGALSAAARKKIDYCAYDMRHDYAKDTDSLAAGLGFRSHDHKLGYLVDFQKHYPTASPFDLVTLTNTVHEVHPEELASILVACIERLSASGCLFLYDMENIRPPELGAVPWTSGEVTKILKVLLESLGVDGYEPAVGQWRHRTCDAWNVQLYRAHMKVSDAELAGRRQSACERTGATIRDLLAAKLDRCRNALDKLTEYGAETADEQHDKDKLLHEHWAVNRALGVVR